MGFCMECPSAAVARERGHKFWLCNRCNSVYGLVKDSPSLLVILADIFGIYVDAQKGNTGDVADILGHQTSRSEGV